MSVLDKVSEVVVKLFHHETDSTPEVKTELSPKEAPQTTAPRTPRPASSVEGILASVEGLTPEHQKQMRQVIQQLQTVISPDSAPTLKKPQQRTH